MTTSTATVDAGGRLSGRVALVTGAGSGIGRGTALRFAAEGAEVWCADLSFDNATETAALVTARGGSARPVQVDVTDTGSVERAFAMVLDRGPVDTLVTFAGVAGPGSALTTTEPEWLHVLDVNLGGVWRCCRAVVPAMIAAGRGSIVTMSSITAVRGFRGVAAYSAAKAGVLGLTRQLAADYSDQGIRVNAIAPGTVPTALVRQMWEAGTGFGAGTDVDDRVRRAAASYPLQRVGTPDDIGSAAVFLASHDADWITGSVLVIDGGKTSII